LAPERAALAAKPSANLQAYDYYLRGNDYAKRMWVANDERLAVQMYERAVALDSTFALAYARLARSDLFLSWNYGRTDELPKAKAAVDRARQLASDLAETHVALGYYFYMGERAYHRALEQFALAERQEPTNPDAIEVTSFVERRLGQWERNLADLARALELNPRSHDLLFNLAWSYLVLRRYPEAQRSIDRAISLAPDIPVYHTLKASLYLMWDGSTVRARQALEEAARTVDPAQVLVQRGYLGLLVRVFGAEFAEPLARLSLRTQGIDTLDYFLYKAELNASTRRPALGRAYFDSARVVSEAYLARHPGVPLSNHDWHSRLALAYAGLGQKALALRTAREGAQLLPVSKDAFMGPYLRRVLAEVYVQTGEYDAALDELEFLLTIPSPVSAPLLRVDPVWKALRGNPRFERLLKRGA
jgi:tetratricopeptide (TPR) repeat protein